MNPKNEILSILCLMLTLSLCAQVQEKKNIVGFGAGICPYFDADVWVGYPVFTWVTKKTSPVIQLFYARQVLEAVRLGTYFEYEYSTFESSNDKASRFNIGFNWLAQYPNTAFHAQLGGYMGFGSIIASNYDKALNGTDVGAMLGPAYENDNFGVALHVMYGKGYYKTSGTDIEVGVAIPRFLLKVYYKF